MSFLYHIASHILPYLLHVTLSSSHAPSCHLPSLCHHHRSLPRFSFASGRFATSPKSSDGRLWFWKRNEGWSANQIHQFCVYLTTLLQCSAASLLSSRFAPNDMHAKNDPSVLSHVACPTVRLHSIPARALNLPFAWRSTQAYSRPSNVRALLSATSTPSSASPAA